jgi:hypothetical protein
MCGTRRYRYSRPVCLGDHRLILRPRDSHDLRLIQTSLNLSPAASIHWFHDVFGNSKKRKQDPRTTSHNIAQHLTTSHNIAQERTAKFTGLYVALDASVDAMCIDEAMTDAVNSKARGNGRQGSICDDRGFGGLRTDREHESNRKVRGHANPPCGPRRVETDPTILAKTNPTRKCHRDSTSDIPERGAGLRAQTQIFTERTQ